MSHPGRYEFIAMQFDSALMMRSWIGIAKNYLMTKGRVMHLLRGGLPCVGLRLPFDHLHVFVPEYVLYK